jgi:hypothetical protein
MSSEAINGEFWSAEFWNDSAAARSRGLDIFECRPGEERARDVYPCSSLSPLSGLLRMPYPTRGSLRFTPGYLSIAPPGQRRIVYLRILAGATIHCLSLHILAGATTHWLSSHLAGATTHLRIGWPGAARSYLSFSLPDRMGMWTWTWT